MRYIDGDELKRQVRLYLKKPETFMDAVSQMDAIIDAMPELRPLGKSANTNRRRRGYVRNILKELESDLTT